MHMKQRWRLICLSMVFLLLMGCSRREAGIEEQEWGPADNLFAQTEAETVSETEETETDPADILSQSVSFGLVPRNLAEDEEKTAGILYYEGGTAQLDFFVNGSEAITKGGLGIMVYIDGKPQPYYTEEEPSYSYMHVFYPGEEDLELSAYFVPVTGQEGDRLEFFIVAVAYPDFKPDLVDTYTFHWAHDMVGFMDWIQYEAAPEYDGEWPETAEQLSSVAVRQEELTAEKKNAILKSYNIEEEDLMTRTYGAFYVDGNITDVMESLNVEGKDSLHLQVELVGGPLAEYSVTFYINHEPVSCDGVTTWEVTMAQGMLAVIEAELDLSKLEEFDVLYAVMMPRNAITMSRAGNVAKLIKSSSIVLYNQSDLSAAERE